MAFSTDGKLGVNLTQTRASASESPDHPLGTHVKGGDNTEWVYVKAAEAITQYACVSIDHDWNASQMTHTLAATGPHVGFAQEAFDSGDYGWVALRGSNISVRVAGSCSKNVQLYTTANAGILDDTATSTAKLLRGVVIVTSNSTTAASTKELRATYPSGTATP